MPATTTQTHARIAGSAWAARAAATAIIVGAAIRIEQFGWRRSLWLDEALVANNVVSRSFAGLLHPLNSEQAAPIGWLWAQRTMVVTFGDNEYALRIVPLLCGIAALFFIHHVARRILGPWPAALAAAVLALSPTAIRYSVEVKQYSSDMAIAAGLVLLALKAVDHRVVDGRQDHHDVARWGIAGGVAVWFSHAAVLVMAATAVVLAADALRRRGGRERKIAVFAAIPSVLVFAIDWLVSLRTLGHDAFLHSYWKAGFPPAPFGLGSYIAWTPRVLTALFVNPGNFREPGVVALAALVGAMVTIWRQPLKGALLVAPVVVAFGAASVGSYPLDGRLSLWLLPVIVLGLAAVVAAAIDAGAGLVERRVAVGVIVAVALVLLARPINRVIQQGHHPPSWQDTRPLLDQVREARSPGDEVWAHSSDFAVVTFYSLATNVLPTGQIDDAMAGGSCPGNADIAAVAGGHRVWLIYGYHGSNTAVDEQQAIVDHLRESSHLVAWIRRPDATAYLLDFSARPDMAPALNPLACITVTRTPPPKPTGLSTAPLGSGRRV